MGTGHRLRFPAGRNKFSKKEHAIPDSTHIQLGSSRYYREYEGDTEGVADPEEDRLVQRGSLREFLEKSGLPPQPGYGDVSSKVTWARLDFLVFCTSAMVEGRGFGELRSQFPDYECATLIVDPSAFALQMGEEEQRRYSPAHCIGIRKRHIVGSPDMSDVSTSCVERHNLTMRMSMRQFTRLTNAFSRKVEKHARTVALYSVWYNWVRMHSMIKATPAMVGGLTDRSIGLLAYMVCRNSLSLPAS